MEPNHLKVAELTYELKVRNVDLVGDVDKKRKILRGLLSQESANRSFIQGSIAHPYTFQNDLKEISETISDLKTVIATYTTSGDCALKKRISSRLTHLSGRMQRLVTENEEEDQQKRELQFLILELEGDFAFKDVPSASTPTALTLPADGAAVSNISNVPSVKSIAPYKWNVTFNGSTKNESLIAFLEKIELLRQARNVSKDELFLSACDLFTGSAWIWFTNNRHKVNNWDELVGKLKQDFLPYCYEDELLQEINSRTQGTHERVALFISSVEGLYNRLPNKPSEDVIVSKIRRNLLPYYISRLALEQPKSVTELSDLCKKLEEARTWSTRYKPPPHPKEGLLEPDLSCVASGSGNSLSKNNSYSKYHSTDKNLSKVNISTVSNITCWNCGKVGHSYNICRNPRQLFCFGCGFKNTTKYRCQKCNPKNKLGRDEQLDVVTSASTSEIRPETQPKHDTKITKQSKK